jgi:hypothetical protein
MMRNTPVKAYRTIKQLDGTETPETGHGIDLVYVCIKTHKHQQDLLQDASPSKKDPKCNDKRIPGLWTGRSQMDAKTWIFPCRPGKQLPRPRHRVNGHLHRLLSIDCSMGECISLWISLWLGDAFHSHACLKI